MITPRDSVLMIFIILLSYVIFFTVIIFLVHTVWG